MMKNLLLIYTRLFDPFIVISLAYSAIFLKFGHFPEDLKWLFFTILINIIIPIFYFINLIRRHEVGNWDVTEKKQRRKVFGPLVIFIGISTIIIYSFRLFVVLSPNAILLFDYLLRLQIAGIILFSYLYFVSPFFKSSGHVGTMSMILPFILKMFGMQFSWVIILIGIQAVARVNLGKHTVKEVTVGFVSGIVIGLLVLIIK
jgi:hypothetical protein